jgi:IS5 family transposase
MIFHLMRSTLEIYWILRAALHGNPYDGHTLKQSLESAQAASRVAVKQTFVDKGYKGAAKDIPEIKVYLSGQRELSREQKKWLRRRQAIEPVIGHLKSDHRMGRNFLHGYEGDRVNAILAAAAFNFAKLFRAAALFIQIFNFQSLTEILRHQKAARFSPAAAVNVYAVSFML